MAFLEEFELADSELLIGLPYRAGLWMSRIDDTGGDDANQDEEKTLMEVIRKRNKKMYDSAFVHEVMQALCDRLGQWQSWEENIDNVPAECKRAVQLLSETQNANIIDNDIAAYKRNIMGIAYEVAVAYREFDHTESLWGRLSSRISITIDKFIGGVKGEQYASDKLLNISYEEDMGLKNLAIALGISSDN